MQKKIFSLFLSVLAFASLSFAQVDKTQVSDHIAVVVVRADTNEPRGEVDTIHTRNVVTVIARHADGREFYRHESTNLKTTGGIDCVASQLANTSTQCVAANYIALSSTLSSPAAGDCAAGSSSCTLVNEITTNGLARAQATYAHTAGTSTYTLTKTWTATATVAAVTGAGIFNAASSGTLWAENTFSSVAMNNGDQISVTWTVTIS